MTRIVPLRTGWDPAAGGAEAYPADLPAEWRLSYFANAHWGALVPSAIWRRTALDQLRAWVADTPPRFRFFLDLDRDLDRGDPQGPLDSVCNALGDRLGGVVAPRSVLLALADASLPRLLRVPPDGVGPDPLPGVGSAWDVPAPLIRDLRGARAWVEDRAGALDTQPPDQTHGPGLAPPLAVLLGECRLEDLGRWQTMLELMGLA